MFIYSETTVKTVADRSLDFIIKSDLVGSTTVGWNIDSPVECFRMN